jgi:hypothetical protein
MIRKVGSREFLFIEGDPNKYIPIDDIKEITYREKSGYDAWLVISMKNGEQYDFDGSKCYDINKSLTEGEE